MKVYVRPQAFFLFAKKHKALYSPILVFFATYNIIFILNEIYIKCPRTLFINILPPFRKKIGLPYFPFCLKLAVFYALLYKIYFLGNFMHYNCFFNIFCIKSSILGENNKFTNRPKKMCSKLAKIFSQPDVTIHTPIESPSQVDQK